MMEDETVQQHIDLLPRTLMWATSADEIKSAKAIHLGRLRLAFCSLLTKLDGQEATEDVARLRDLVSRASEEEVDNVLLCPNISNLLTWISHVDRRALRALIACFALHGSAARLEHLPGPYWCPSGNKYVSSNGAVSQWPILGNRIRVDLDSPDRIATGSDLPSTVTHWRPLDKEKRAATLDALSEAYICVRDARPSLDIFMEACAGAVVLRQTDDGRFSSFSSAHFVGRITLVNPQLNGRLLLAEALLHEAIHSYLYMLEPNPFWGLASATAGADAKIQSPWTGRDLPLYAFLHACFVWYGLFFFWSRLVQNNRGSDREVLRHLGYAARGFMRGGALPDLISRRDRTLVKEAVLCSIGSMQSNVIRVAEK